jgi:hypothetical protein
MPRVYDIVQDRVSMTAAVQTLIEFTNASDSIIIVLRAWIGQSTNVTSAQQTVSLVRKSGAGTNVTAPVANPKDVGDPAIGATLRGLCTTVGTVSVVLYPDTFNWVNGWLWLPVPEERHYVSPSGIYGLHIPVAPAALTVSCGITVMEIG